jgi:hypothetical protein
MNDPTTHPKQHYWIAEGNGELTSRWFNPVCDPKVRRHTTDFAADDNSPAGGKCDDCLAIVTAMEQARPRRLRPSRDPELNRSPGTPVQSD